MPIINSRDQLKTLLAMLQEPPPTQADLHFQVAGIPVRIHPFFWVVGLLLGLSSFDGEPVGTLLSVGVVFVSILVHELGHAALQRHFGGRPRIVLHGIGGLAICGDCDRSPRSQILISLAGPFAGFLLALFTIFVVGLTSDFFAVQPFWADQESIGPVDPAIIDRVKGHGVVLGTIWFANFSSMGVNYFLSMMLFVNIVWGLVNLLPVYPLDGGQVAREVLTLGASHHAGLVLSMKISMVVAAAMALFGLIVWKSIFVALMFGFLAYNNYQIWQAYTGRGPGRGWQ